MDYTQLIERLRSNTVGYASLLGKAADAIEALQAQIAEQDHELADTAFLAGQYKAERDTAQAKLRELEAQPSPTALELMTEYSNGKQWAMEQAQPKPEKPPVNLRLVTALLQFVPVNVCLTNTNWPDTQVIPLDVTMGEMREAAAALAEAAKGGAL